MPGSSERRQTVTSTRQPLSGSSEALQSILAQAQGLPEVGVSQDPTTAAGLRGLESVAAQPGIAGGAGFLNQFLGEGGGLGTAIGTLQGTAAGDLVESNPALLQALEANREARTGGILDRFTAAGRTGLNPAVAQAITEANARAELPVIAQDIATQQARQQQAAQFLPGLFGTLGQAATFAPGLQLQAGQTREALDRQNQAAELQRALAALQIQQGAAGTLGGLGGTTTQQSVRPGPNRGMQLLGLGTTLAGAALGGPAGASIGSALGSGLGGMFGGGAGAGGNASGTLAFGQGV